MLALLGLAEGRFWSRLDFTPWPGHLAIMLFIAACGLSRAVGGLLPPAPRLVSRGGILFILCCVYGWRRDADGRAYHARKMSRRGV